MEYIDDLVLSLMKNDVHDASQVRKELFSLFNERNDRNYDWATASPEESEELAKWLFDNRVYALKAKEFPYSKQFLTEGSKVMNAVNYRCQICGKEVDRISFAFRINPTTRQTPTSVKNAFISQFQKRHPLNTPFDRNDRLCVKIVYTINKSRDKDLDNLAKLTLDALKVFIGIDDKNIDHLDLIKLKTSFVEGFIGFSMARSLLSMDNVILRCGHFYVDGEKLDSTPEIPQPE